MNQSFRLSPLIRFTLLSLYGSLMIPLPFLAKATETPIDPLLVWLFIILGFVVLLAILSERVVVSSNGISVSYESWVPILSGWSLPWQEIKELKMRTTGQGGIVYYFVSNSKAYLLPMRVAGFSKLLKEIENNTAIDTKDIAPLAQPWMYLALLVLTVPLYLVDLWVIFNVSLQ
jgi:hypothetical protein